MNDKSETDTKPVETGPPRCRGCGARLALTPIGIAQPSVDWVNWMNNVPYCQSCIVARASE